MKRRFRITITPDAKWETFNALRVWTRYNWGYSLFHRDLLFKGFLRNEYVAGIEVFDKTAKAL